MLVIYVPQIHVKTTPNWDMSGDARHGEWYRSTHALRGQVNDPNICSQFVVNNFRITYRRLKMSAPPFLSVNEASNNILIVWQRSAEG